MTLTQDPTSPPTDLPDPLAALGVHGFRFSSALIAALALREAVLLVGPVGTAKTALAAAVSRALGLPFHAYSAPKLHDALMEMLGFAVPSALDAGRLELVPTPVSLSNFGAVLIDELNRGENTDLSLELIRSKQVFGMSFGEESGGRLRHVFAAMNPPGGIEGLSSCPEALRDRFIAILPVPTYAELGDEARRAVLLGEDPDRESADFDGEAFKTLVGETERRLTQLAPETCKLIEDWADTFVLGASHHELPLSGRRAKMIYRLGCARVAVEQARRSDATVGFGDALAVDVALASSPLTVMTDPPMERATLARLARIALAKASGADWTESLLLPKDPIERVAVLCGRGLEPDQQKAVITGLIEPGDIESPTVKDLELRRRIAVAAASRALTAGHLRLEPQDAARLLEELDRLLGTGPRADRSSPGALWAVERAISPDGELDPLLVLATRLASSIGPGDPGSFLIMRGRRRRPSNPELPSSIKAELESFDSRIAA